VLGSGLGGDPVILEQGALTDPAHADENLGGASDRRAAFVGVEVYEAAGGTISHNLFQGDDGG
jgi:hypothetical protein